jgi:hypothetical protein
LTARNLNDRSGRFAHSPTIKPGLRRGDKLVALPKHDQRLYRLPLVAYGFALLSNKFAPGGCGKIQAMDAPDARPSNLGFDCHVLGLTCIRYHVSTRSLACEHRNRSL